MQETLKLIAEQIKLKGGRLFIVGGWIRDRFMGIKPTDLDLMTLGLSEDIVIDIFGQFGQFEKVIGNAPVFMFSCNGESVEVALARKEISVSQGKHGFDFVADESVTLKEDLSRRDFTINAMAEDFLTGDIFDFFGGQSDIEGEILRPVSDAFEQSPERIFRGMAQAARFDFIPTNEFFDMGVEMKKDFNTIPVEQIWRHFEKMLLKGKNIALGLDILRFIDWVEFFPELDNLIGCEQDSEWHPEGDVFIHTQLVVNEMTRLCDEENIQGRQRVKMLLSAICHDMGKPDTTFVNEEGRIVSPGHAQENEVILSFLDRIGCPESLKDDVLTLANEHMVHVSVDKVTTRFVKRLSNRLGQVTIKELSMLVEADHSGRDLPKGMPEKMQLILELADSLDLTEQEIQGLIMGRHLIARGMTPSPKFGEILNKCFEAQLNEEFDNLDDGLVWLENNICKCGEFTGHVSPCPYAEDIHGEISECSCCAICRQICSDDI